MRKIYYNTHYQNKNIENIEITNYEKEEIESFFFHYSWNKCLESYDTKGMEPVIGENSKGIDEEKSIFFSKGLEGCLAKMETK